MDIDCIIIDNLEIQMQITDEAEADFIFKVVNSQQKEFIIHIEFQSGNDNTMLNRMLKYYAFIFNTYQLPIKQYVIYIGNEKMNMVNELQDEDLQYQYHLFDMKSIPYDKFIQSDRPEEIVLSILCDFGNSNNKLVVQEILLKIKNKVTGELLLSKYIRQLEVLAQLRNLQEVVRDTEKEVPVIFNLKDDIRFKEGKEEGKEIGKEERSIEIAKNMLKKGIDTELIMEVTNLSKNTLEQLKSNLS